METMSTTYTFKSIELLKNETIGIGAYGKVCKAKCDELICAAKLLHETLVVAVQSNVDPKHVKPIRRFEQECEFMSTIRHPNIVQFLCLHEDSATTLPVLLMELMDENLTSFLNKSSGPLPYHVQVNLCHDVCVALSYLHDNNIIHRDLSSNNILLIGSVRAKVADFGMAKLVDLCPPDSRSLLTKDAGTNTYLPYESECTAKVDCFSFGVVAVQVVTRQTPSPTKRFVGEQGANVFHKVSEFDRRKSHIDKIDPAHPFIKSGMVCDCLKDEANDRPSAKELCKRLTDLKNFQEYEDSQKTALGGQYSHHGNGVRCEPQNDVDHSSRSLTANSSFDEEKEKQISTLTKQVESQRQRLEEQEKVISEREGNIKDKDELIEQKDLEIEQLTERVESQREFRKQSEQLRNRLGDKDRLLAESERYKAGIQQQLSVCKSEKDALEKQVQELTLCLRHKGVLRLLLRWYKDAKKAPQGMYRSNDAAVDGCTAYFRPATTKRVYRFNKMDGWSRLSDCLYDSSPLVIINGVLTTVGGNHKGSCVDKLLSLSVVGTGNRWIESLPPMPTKRSHTSALCTGTHLIVAGGTGDRGDILKVVEVLIVESRQWVTSVAISLPEPCRCSSMCVLDGHLFVVGGVNAGGRQTNLGYACSLSSLYQSLCSRPQESTNGLTSPSGSACSTPVVSPERHPILTHTYDVIPSTERVWWKIRDLPVTSSTIVSFHGRLLAIGGKNLDQHNPATEVYVYSPIFDTWEVVGHIITGRASCFAAALSDNELMIVGGKTDIRTTLDSVEFANVV